MAVEDIPDSGLHIEIDAPAAVRAQMLAALGLAVRDLPQLSAVFDLTRRGAKDPCRRSGQRPGGADLRRHAGADGKRRGRGGRRDLCAGATPKPTTGDEVDVRCDNEPPEPLVDGKVDLGALATEFLVLGIDPYPRKPGAEFTPPKVENDEANPFAALEALKKRLGGGKP